MARKKGSPAEEQARRGLTDGRYKDPLDKRIQGKKITKALDQLRKV